MPTPRPEDRRDAIEEELAKAWNTRVAWSRAADALKASLVRTRTATLVLASAGAVLETAAATILAAHGDARTAVAGIGAVALALGTYLTARVLTPDVVRAWTRARSVSEGMKKEFYVFRAGADPYAGPDAALALFLELEKIADSASDLQRHADEWQAAPEARKTPPPVFAPGDYVAKRVQSQIDGYYRPRARDLAQRLRTLRRVEFMLGVLATAAGSIAAYPGGPVAAAGASGGWFAVLRAEAATIGAWVAVLTTVAGAIAAHVAASRYDFLVMSYSATARRLDELVRDWRLDGAPTDRPAWSTFVQACETAISVENESWLAKWADHGKPSADAAP
jgi:hypothetical protein